MAAAGAFSGVGASGVQCDKMSNARLGAGGRTRRGQDSISAHFELFLSFLPPPTFQLGRACLPRGFFFCHPLPSSPLPPLHIFITPAAVSISPLCVDRGTHSVSHSRSINDQLEHGATQSSPPPPAPQPPPPCLPRLSHTHTHTHTHFNYFCLL